MQEKTIYNIGEKLVFTQDTEQEGFFNKKNNYKTGNACICWC